MGKTSHSAPGDFATELGDYLRFLIKEHGGNDDLSGRWMEKHTGKARSRDYWSGIIKGAREMTTNDIAVIADSFGLPVFDFVPNAKQLAETGTAPAGNVAPHPEDYDISGDPGDFGLAAKKRQNPGD